MAADPNTEDESVGYTDATTSLLYKVHVLGKSSAHPGDIRDWVAAATSTTVLSVESLETDDANFFGSH